VIDSIAFGPDGASAPPHLLRLLVSTVLATDERSPICIVLPSVERVASVISILAALECLSFDLPANREAFLSDLRPGQRVRLYPTGDVFEIGGVTDGSAGMRMLRLHPPDLKQADEEMDRTQLDTAYNNTAAVPECDAIVAGWAAPSARVRRERPGIWTLPTASARANGSTCFSPPVRRRRPWPSSTAATGR
jgi:hypothetical protein